MGPQTHVMVDLETLGTSARSAILTIGAVKFDPRGQGVSAQFYRRVDADSCKAIGLEIDRETIEWWNKQSAEARQEAFLGADRLPIKNVLVEFSVWLGSMSAIWSHGATFDIPILSEAYKKIGQRAPWSYTAARDTRTLFDLAGMEMKRVGTHHNALDDAISQAQTVQAAYAKLFSQAGSEAAATGSVCARY